MPGDCSFCGLFSGRSSGLTPLDCFFTPLLIGKTLYKRTLAFLGGSWEVPGSCSDPVGLDGSSREVPKAVLIRTVFIIRKSVVFLVWPQ